MAASMAGFGLRRGAGGLKSEQVEAESPASCVTSWCSLYVSRQVVYGKRQFNMIVDTCAHGSVAMRAHGSDSYARPRRRRGGSHRPASRCGPCGCARSPGTRAVTAPVKSRTYTLRWSSPLVPRCLDPAVTSDTWLSLTWTCSRGRRRLSAREHGTGNGRDGHTEV